MIYRGDRPEEFAQWYGHWDTTDEDDLRIALVSVPPTAEDFGVMWYLIRAVLEERRAELRSPPGSAKADAAPLSNEGIQGRRRLLALKERLLDQCY